MQTKYDSVIEWKTRFEAVAGEEYMDWRPPEDVAARMELARKLAADLDVTARNATTKHLAQRVIDAIEAFEHGIKELKTRDG